MILNTEPSEPLLEPKLDSSNNNAEISSLFDISVVSQNELECRELELELCRQNPIYFIQKYLNLEFPLFKIHTDIIEKYYTTGIVYDGNYPIHISSVGLFAAIAIHKLIFCKDARIIYASKMLEKCFIAVIEEFFSKIPDWIKGTIYTYRDIGKITYALHCKSEDNFNCITILDPQINMVGLFDYGITATDLFIDGYIDASLMQNFTDHILLKRPTSTLFLSSNFPQFST